MSSQKAAYQGISRKYRPQTFASVVGQEAIVTTLKNAMRLKKTAQAYLFCGTRGTGKTTLARVLAKALNCESLSQEGEPCNICTSCLEIMQGKSLNVFEIDGASNRGIDDIRQLTETVGYAAASKGYKIYIIDEVHMLTKEAFNALLKTLEEPPSNVKFFFATTEPHKVLPTILSRCQRFDLQRISAQNIFHKLIQVAIDLSIPYEEEALHRIAELSDGSLRVAESLLDQILCFSEGTLNLMQVNSSLGLVSSDYFFALDEAFVKQDLSVAFSITETVFSSGKDFAYFLECLLEHYRTIAAMQLKQPLTDLSPVLREKYAHSATLYTQQQSLYILDYLVQWYQQVNKTPFKRVFLEMILLHVIKSRQRVAVSDLVSKLKSLQSSKAAETFESDEKNAAPVKTEIAQNRPDIPIQKEEKKVVPSSNLAEQNAKHETLMRFAAVELEGVLTKGPN